MTDKTLTVSVVVRPARGLRTLRKQKHCQSFASLRIAALCQSFRFLLRAAPALCLDLIETTAPFFLSPLDAWEGGKEKIQWYERRSTRNLCDNLVAKKS